MSIKMNSKSVLTVLFVGSLCGLTNYVNASQDDFNEEEGSRLQITAATAQILAAVADSDGMLQDNGVVAGTVIVGGTTYTAGTNDLTSISRGLSAVEGADFAASASLAALAGLDNTAGTALTPGAAYTTGTNDLTSLSLALSTIEGAVDSTHLFTMGLSSLYINARQVALGQVIAAASNPAINLPVTTTVATTGNTFSAQMLDVFNALVTAFVNPNNTNILAVDTELTQAVLDAAALVSVTSAYPQAAVQAAVQALETAVDSWLAFYAA